MLVQQVGYEILIPANVSAAIQGMNLGDELALHIYHYQTERQPKPVLIGFIEDLEKEFFQQFLTVEAIGPLKAVKALTIPVGEFALAIETRDVAALKRLKGIGERMARKIVATLEGKVGQYALAVPDQQAPFTEAEVMTSDKFSHEVIDVLIQQLGYKKTEAQQMVSACLKRNPGIDSAEELFDEVLKSAPTT